MNKIELLHMYPGLIDFFDDYILDIQKATEYLTSIGESTECLHKYSGAIILPYVMSTNASITDDLGSSRFSKKISTTGYIVTDELSE